MKPPPVTVAPFNSHIARPPVAVLVQKRSFFPSPLKSPVPLIDHSTGTVPINALATRALPFINHIARSPVTEFDRKISAFPSPLKSPTPVIAQSVGTVPSVAPAV